MIFLIWKSHAHTSPYILFFLNQREQWPRKWDLTFIHMYVARGSGRPRVIPACNFFSKSAWIITFFYTFGHLFERYKFTVETSRIHSAHGRESNLEFTSIKCIFKCRSRGSWISCKRYRFAGVPPVRRRSSWLAQFRSEVGIFLIFYCVP